MGIYYVVIITLAPILFVILGTLQGLIEGIKTSFEGVGKTIKQLVLDNKNTADRIRTLKRDYGRRIWIRNK